MNREDLFERELEELNQEEMGLFIERLKGLMQMYNLTQRELAQRVKITEVSMSRYVNGTRQPRPIILANIARELGTSMDYLLGLTENIASSQVIQCGCCVHKEWNDTCPVMIGLVRDNDYCSYGKRKSK